MADTPQLFRKKPFERHEVDGFCDLARSVSFEVKLDGDDLIHINYPAQYPDEKWFSLILPHPRVATLVEFRHLTFMCKDSLDDDNGADLWYLIPAQRKWFNHGKLNTLPKNIRTPHLELKLFKKEDGSQVKCMASRFFTKKSEITNQIVELLTPEQLEAWTDLFEKYPACVQVAEWNDVENPQFTAYEENELVLLGRRNTETGTWTPASQENGIRCAQQIQIPEDIETRDSLIEWITQHTTLGEGVMAAWVDETSTSVMAKIKTSLYYDIRYAIGNGILVDETGNEHKCGRNLLKLWTYVEGQEDWDFQKKQQMKCAFWSLSSNEQKYTLVIRGMEGLHMPTISREAADISAMISEAIEPFLHIIESGDRSRIFKYACCFKGLKKGLQNLTTSDEVLDSLTNPYLFVQAICDPTILQKKKKKKKK